VKSNTFRRKALTPVAFLLSNSAFVSVLFVSYFSAFSVPCVRQSWLYNYSSQLLVSNVVTRASVIKGCRQNYARSHFRRVLPVPFFPGATYQTTSVICILKSKSGILFKDSYMQCMLHTTNRGCHSMSYRVCHFMLYAL